MAVRQKILVIDDDKVLCHMVDQCLTSAGYDVVQTYDGSDVIELVERQGTDLAIVDLKLPGEDGFSITRRLRNAYDIGLVILTSSSELDERVRGLESGADDYICKPFEPRELQARVKSVLRRVRPKETPVASTGYKFLGWSLDTVSRSLRDPRGTETHLTSGEYELLVALIEHAPDVLSRELLVTLTHRTDLPAFDRSIDVQIGRLRKKLAARDTKYDIIKTIRNAGYTFAAPVEMF